MALSSTLYPMDVSDILDGLNEAQRAAVAAEQGNQLVLAGAGRRGPTCPSRPSLLPLLHCLKKKPRCAQTMKKPSHRKKKMKLVKKFGGAWEKL